MKGRTTSSAAESTSPRLMPVRMPIRSNVAARTSVGEIPYELLLVAVGAVPAPAGPGALTFRGPADTDKIRTLLGDTAAGEVRRIAFVVPSSGAAWSLPLSELALMTAAHLGAQGIRGVELALVTSEERPLRLFGRAGSDAVRELLEGETDLAIARFDRAPPGVGSRVDR